MNIHLYIERLVLDSMRIAHGQRNSLQTAVEAEPVRLLTAGGVSQQLAGGGTMPRVAGSAIRLGAANSPTELGRQIAGIVYGGIGI